MVKITLDYPVDLPGGGKVTELAMRRPKAKDEARAKFLSLIDAEVEMNLFAILTGQPFDVIAGLDLEGDYAALGEVYKSFGKKRVVKPGEPVVLDYPVELAPHPKVTELTMRRPKAVDELEANRLADNPEDVEIRLFALLTGLAPEVIGELDLLSDMQAVRSAYANFRKKPAATSAGAAPTTSESNASASSPTA